MLKFSLYETLYSLDKINKFTFYKKFFDISHLNFEVSFF